MKSESINNFPELINKSWSKIISDRGYWKYGNPLTVEFDGNGNFRYLLGAGSDNNKWIDLKNN